ncbi:MAG: hypothetical protein VYD19_07210 [Myxococcota bacterium]|nr:hypothetical protein [Myxococcota bacterium]
MWQRLTIDRGNLPALPPAALSELSGPTDSGKTWAALTYLERAKGRGEVGVFFDLAWGLSPHIIAPFAPALERLLVLRPSSIEALISQLNILLRKRCTDLIIIDAFSALPLEEERRVPVSVEGIHSRSTLLASLIPRLASAAARAQLRLLMMNPCEQGELPPMDELFERYARLRLSLKPSLDADRSQGEWQNLAQTGFTRCPMRSELKSFHRGDHHCTHGPH